MILVEIIYDNSKLFLGRNSIASHRNYSKTNPNCVWAIIQLHLIGIFLRQFQMVSQPKFHCISSKSFWDFSRLCRSQNSIAPHLIFSNTFPNCVLAKIQLHLIGIFLRQFQMVSQPKFHCISSKLFWDFSRLCLSPNSHASYRKYSKTIPSCVLAEIQLHFIEKNLRLFQIVSKPKFNCTSLELL